MMYLQDLKSGDIKINDPLIKELESYGVALD
jgi:hypothetical protein